MEPGKIENRLIFLCRDVATSGGLGGKLAFAATRCFLKMKDCCGEEDLPDEMGQQQVGQPDEEREGDNLGSKDTIHEDAKWQLQETAQKQ